LSIKDFSIIDSTLREGEQSGKFQLNNSEKEKLIEMLDEFGIEGIELTSPATSDKAFDFCKKIASMNLKARIYTHVRCHPDDITKAIDTGVQGINLFMGTSRPLITYSHGHSISQITDMAGQMIHLIREKAPATEIRFSCEDTFRSNIHDILEIFQSLENLGEADRYGLADTVGIAFPDDISQLVRSIRKFSQKAIEYHGHNDSGCAIINSWTALQAGATHIDTSILGIGERNGITPLCGLIARLYTGQVDLSKYNLKILKDIVQTFAGYLHIEIPFNHYIFGENAFCHKGGIHSNAVIKNPESYESINPDDFEIQRKIMINHEMVGWHSVKKRLDILNLIMDDEKIKEVTLKIKKICSFEKVTLEQIDRMLKEYAEMYTIPRS